MTVLGKILVFINLVFSLLTAGLIVLVFVTRTNWSDQYKKTIKEVTVYLANADANVTEAELKTRAANAATQAELRAKQALEIQLATAKDATKKVEEELAEAKKAKDVETQLNTASAGEKERRRVEVEKLLEQIKQKNDRLVNLENEVNKFRGEATRNKIEFEQARDRNTSLLAQVEALQRDIFNRRNPPANPGQPQKLPPPTNARARIVTVEGSLAKINLGSDAGLSRDQVFDVYRLEPQPKLIGSFTVLTVSPTEAVGRITLSSTNRTPAQVGDEVGTIGK